MWVSVEGCSEAIVETRLGAALEVELKSLHPELVEHIRRSQPKAFIRCQPTDEGSRVSVVVETVEGEALSEQLDAEEEGLERFIAIAVAESLAAQAALLRARATVKPEPPAEPKPEPATRPIVKPEPAEPARREWWWRGQLLLRAFGEPDLSSPGVRAQLDTNLSRYFASGGNLELTHGSTRVNGGRISASTISVGVDARYRWVDSRFLLSPGVGARAGLVIWNGVPDDATGLSGRAGVAGWGGPYATLLSGVAVTPAFRAELGFEAGANPGKVDATQSGSQLATLGLFWFSMQLGVSGRIE